MALSEVSLDIPGNSLTKSRQKLGRSGVKSWFHRSFDQSFLQHDPESCSSSPSLKRQKSVSDFFHDVLAKSRSHLQDIFTPRREQTSDKTTAEFEDLWTTVPSSMSPSNTRAEDRIEHSRGASQANMTRNPLHCSCPNVSENHEAFLSPATIKHYSSLKTGSKHKYKEKNISATSQKPSIPESVYAPLNLFVVTGHIPLIVPQENLESSGQHRPIVRQQNHQCSLVYEASHVKFKSSLTSLILSNENKYVQSASFGPCKHWSPKISSLPQMQNLDNADHLTPKETPISFLPSRRSMGSSAVFLNPDDQASQSKRALTKSNSDTFSKLDVPPEPLTKASSDNNCFRNNSSSSLACSMTSVGSIMIGVTDYLYLGSIEAAYNEPLLCRYNISSMIDMTNIHPALVPPQKKSNCPCPCSKKTHFRSKLNIGVDDIEWENIQQYFSDINAFIHGARRSGRRVLVFSYMGQSRAAAAVIQHIMEYYRIPYQHALQIVQAKRPQVRLNSGFVKALLRLEKTLGLTEDPAGDDAQSDDPQRDSLPLRRRSVDMLDDLSAPPVVRGAWLDC